MAYQRSETAATIIRRSFQKVRDGGEACRVEFEAEHAHAEDGSVWFINDEALSRLRYISPSGVEPFQRSRMWVHEAVHWLTKTFDPYRREAVDNRGATVYLTDRILSELGDLPPILPRTAYIAAPDLEANPNGRSKPPGWNRALRYFNDMTVAENIFLDHELDGRRTFPSTMHLFGQAVAERVTVRQILALDGYLSTLGELASGNGGHIFDLIGDAFTAPPWLHFRSKLRTLVMGSDIFRKMAVAWNSKLRMGIIDIAVEDFNSHEYLYDDAIRHGFFITQDGEQIILNKQELYYFSAHGVKMMSPMRQLIGAMMDLFLRDMLPVAHYLPIGDVFFDRGAGVLLENLILQQLGDTSPRRICGALTSDPQAYLASQSTITRTAVSEDGYLRRKLYEGESSEPVADWQAVDDDAEPTGRCLSFLCLGLSPLR
jgi:hypothetical protein